MSRPVNRRSTGTSEYDRHERIVVPRYRTEKTETPSPYGGVDVRYNHRVPNGETEATIALHIDIDGIIEELGTKAVKSKSGRATAMRGLVVVKVDRRSIVHHPPKP